MLLPPAVFSKRHEIHSTKQRHEIRTHTDQARDGLSQRKLAHTSALSWSCRENPQKSIPLPSDNRHNLGRMALNRSQSSTMRIRIKDKRNVVWVGAAPDTMFYRENANDAHLIATMIYLNTTHHCLG